MKYLGKSMEALARKINNYLSRDILSRKCARGMPWKVVKMGKHFAKKNIWYEYLYQVLEITKHFEKKISYEPLSRPVRAWS